MLLLPMWFYALYVVAKLANDPAVQKAVAPKAPAVYTVKPFPRDVIIRPFSG